MSGREMEEKIGKLQLFEQNLQQLGLQRQQFQAQLIELDSALKELASTKKAYKIIGSIMVASDKDGLEKELKDKKEMFGIRISSVEKQEQQLGERAQALRNEIVAGLKKNKNEP